jgi:transposase
MDVGIDVAKDELVVAIRPAMTVSRYPNDAAGIARLVTDLSPHAPVQVVFEATGGYEQPAALALVDAGVRTYVVNARRIRRFAEGIGANAKTDPLDAAVIAQFAEQAMLGDPLTTTPAQRTLAALVTRRRQLVAAIVAERNQARTAHPEVAASHATILGAFEQELRRITARITAAIADASVFQAKAELLTSVPGIGTITAATLLAELPELGTVSRGRASSLVGAAPFTRQSGKTTFPAHIRGGRADLRTTVYMATLTAKRCNPVIKAFYDRLLARHKPPKVALVAAMRKLITILNTMLRDGTPWQPPVPIT